MAAKSTALTLSSAAPAKRKSFRATPQNIVMQQVAQLWNTLDAITQGGWQTLADTTVAPTVQGVRTNATAYGRFYAHNSTLINAEAPAVTIAPKTPSVQPLPPVRLVITYNGSTPELLLFPNTPYPYNVIIQGAKPLYAGQNAYKKGAFKKIGALNGISLTTDITALYLSKYRLPTSGYQVALKLIGVSPDGTRTPPLFVTAIAISSGTGSAPALTIE